MGLQVVRNVATSLAVTAAEAKLYMKTNYGTDADEDNIVEELIYSAQRFLEDMGGFSIASSTWKAWSDRPCDLREFIIPMQPIISIQYVYRIDDIGTETALTLNTDYYKKGLTDLTLFFSADSSDGVPRGGNVANYYPIRVEYTAGHATVPDDLKIAVMTLVAENYINRKDTTMTGIQIVPHTAIQKTAGYCRQRIF